MDSPETVGSPSAKRGLSRRSVLIGAGALGGLAVVAAVPLALNNSAKQAALIVTNGVVWTGDAKRGATAVAIAKDGSILAVGSAEDVQRYQGSATETIDARGGSILPGIHDAHQHPLGGAEGTSYPSLNGETLTVEGLQDKLRQILAEDAGSDEDWLVVVDWNPAGLTDAVADRRYLDVLDTPRPIYLTGADFHNAWVNTKALTIAGVGADTPDPAGGQIVRDADGPTGLLKDSAQGLVRDIIPELSETQKLAAYEKAFQFTAGLGITSFMDAAGSGESVQRFEELRSKGYVKQRVQVAQTIDADLADKPRDALEKIEEVRSAVNPDSGVSVRTAKVFMDGVVEYPAQTAAMLEPYLDGAGGVSAESGSTYVDAKTFASLATVLDAAGWQIHTHSIGDAAVRTSLDGFEAARQSNGERDSRHTITHIQFCDRADVPRFKQLGVIANMQLHWASENSYTLDALKPYVRPEVYSRMYPAGELSAAGARMAGSSDWPVDVLNPWNQVGTAVDRIGTLSETGVALGPDQSVNLDTSLGMHTTGSAYQLFSEKTGILSPGMQADLVILDQDLSSISIDGVSSSVVQYTIIAGEVVHEPSMIAQSSGALASSQIALSAASFAERHRHCHQSERA